MKFFFNCDKSAANFLAPPFFATTLFFFALVGMEDLFGQLVVIRQVLSILLATCVVNHICFGHHAILHWMQEVQIGLDGWRKTTIVQKNLNIHQHTHSRATEFSVMMTLS